MGYIVKLFVFLAVVSFSDEVTSGNSYTKSKTILELISGINRLRQIATMIDDAGLSLFFEETHITAFIPTTEALLTFDEKKYGYDLQDRETVRSLLLYHLVAGTYLTDDLPEVKDAQSLHPSGFKVYFNQFKNGDEQVFTVNGAVLISYNITASNGVLHIIDRVLAPITSSKTLHDYIIYPEIPHYTFSSINNASIVDLDLKKNTTDSNRKFTVFLPDDNHLVSMPTYGQDKLFTDWYLLRRVYHAHTVLNTFSFIPSKGDIPPLTSMQGNVAFHRENGKVYIKNNRVKALVLQANVPTVNGIIHVIDNLLYFVYRNVVQMVQKLPNTQSFKLYLQRHTEMASYLENIHINWTVFVPTDTAFAKLPTSKQQQLNSDMNMLTKVLGNHMIPGDFGESSLTDGTTLTTRSGRVLSVSRRDDRIYLHADDVQITVEETDIGCTNGVIHLISNVILKKDYTVWEAISGNDQLMKMKSFIEKYNDLTSLLNNNGVHLTVFLPFDYVMDDIPGSTLSGFTSNPDVLYNALSGHVILGHTVTSFNITMEEIYSTYGGHKLRVVWSRQEITVTGSYIRAGVIVSDILCSNGVIHVIDNLIHVPTRNVLDEMKRHPEISVVSSFVGLYTMQTLQNLLSNEEEDVMIFVPTNDAFNDIPRDRADKLLMDSLLLERILQAHVVTSGSHLVEQLYAEQNLVSEQDTIYVKRANNTVGLVSNNVHSEITRSNVRATNGIIHMVNRLLYYPYFSVAETMSRNDKMTPFFEMMYNTEEFMQLADSDDEELTVFVPSPESLANISNPSILTQLYLGHVLPGIKLDQRYLRKQRSEHIIEKSRNNVTFSLQNETIGFSVDVGYSNLRYYFNIISDGIACSNGIVYVIDGLLNYNGRSLLEEIHQDSGILKTFQFMLQFWPNGSYERINRTDRTYTIFLPTVSFIDSLTEKDLTVLRKLKRVEKEQFFDRHVILDQMINLHDIADNTTIANNVTVNQGHEEMFTSWNKTKARVVRPNILSSNGLIQIIDNLFIDLPEQPTTASPSGTTKKSSHTNSSSRLSFSFVIVYFLFIFVYLIP